MREVAIDIAFVACICVILMLLYNSIGQFLIN